MLNDIYGRNKTDLDDNWYVTLITKCIANIQVIGFNLNSIPAITNLTHMINQSYFLKKNY